MFIYLHNWYIIILCKNNVKEALLCQIYLNTPSKLNLDNRWLI
ncbi:protein of unknown function [Clostridium beijerinckii]|nr:protein of unknown function [Clostridium beijerinckii]